VAHSERLASRVREILAEGGQVAERRMFGGLAFMVNGHMCCGIIRDDLMLRLGADQAGQALKEPHVRPMDFTGRPLRGVRVRRSARVEDRGQASPLARAGPPVHRPAAAEVAELPPAGSSHRVTRRPCATSTGCGSRSTQPSGVPPTPPTRSPPRGCPRASTRSGSHLLQAVGPASPTDLVAELRDAQAADDPRPRRQGRRGRRRGAGRQDVDANVNMGLSSAPVLMAADILSLSTDVVPGRPGPGAACPDRLGHRPAIQHDLGRGAACAGAVDQRAARVHPGLDGPKMRQSHGNTIPLFCS
jgi:hypothetical protein